MNWRSSPIDDRSARLIRPLVEALEAMLFARFPIAPGSELERLLHTRGSRFTSISILTDDFYCYLRDLIDRVKRELPEYGDNAEPDASTARSDGGEGAAR